MLNIDISPTAVLPKQTRHSPLGILHAVRISLRTDTNRMGLRRKNARQHSFVEQQPRLEFPFDANSNCTDRWSTWGLPQAFQGMLPIVVPTQRITDFGPRGSFVPENDDAVATVVEQAGGCRAALLDEACVVIHWNDIEIEFNACMVAQQSAKATAEHVLQSLTAAFDENSDLLWLFRLRQPAHRVKAAGRKGFRPARELFFVGTFERRLAVDSFHDNDVR